MRKPSCREGPALGPTRRCGPARAEPRLPESNPGLFKCVYFPPHLTHHLPSFQPQRKLPVAPGSGGNLLRQRLLLRLICFLSKTSQAGGSRRGGRNPPPPPPQDEVLHSLGVQKGSLCCGKALKAASTQLPTSLPASGLVPGPVGGRLAAAAVRALRCLSPPWWAGRRLWEVERTRLLFRA